MPIYAEPPTGSPFLSIAERDPDRPAAKLCTLILVDLKAVPQRIAQLSEWLSARNYSFSIDLILVLGVSRPAPNCVTRHQSLAEQANDTATLSQLELICPRVIYVPGLHEHPTAWESRDELTPKLTPHSHNAVAGPIHVAPDLYIVHRRYADGISDKPIHYLPLSWKQTIYSKLTRPSRFRTPLHPSAIVLCTSQLPDDHTSKSKTVGFFRSVRSLLSLSSRSSVPQLDNILSIVPPKMQRLPTSSVVYRSADRTLDPGSFDDGTFCIGTFVRPDIWDPTAEPDIDDEQLGYESAWEVENITKYNLNTKSDDDDDDDNENFNDENDRNSYRDGSEASTSYSNNTFRDNETVSDYNDFERDEYDDDESKDSYNQNSNGRLDIPRRPTRSLAEMASTF